MEPTIHEDPAADEAICAAVATLTGLSWCKAKIFDAGFKFGVAARHEASGERHAIRYLARPEPEVVRQDFQRWLSTLAT